MKYRKRPIIVEAFQWGVDEIPTWWREQSGEFNIDTSTGSVFIPTLEGIHEAGIDDYIIQGIKGELYPCKPDIFELTYEAVPQATKEIV